MAQRPALAELIPDSPDELLAVAEALRDWRGFVESCARGVWPSLAEHLVDLTPVMIALAAVRRERRQRRSSRLTQLGVANRA